jgi:hypothetical protein
MFIRENLGPAAQLEALPPDTLTWLVKRAVEAELDLDALRETRAQERRERKQVQARLDVVNRALVEAFGLEDG